MGFFFGWVMKCYYGSSHTNKYWTICKWNHTWLHALCNEIKISKSQPNLLSSKDFALPFLKVW
jgi:hypothetical protein